MLTRRQAIAAAGGAAALALAGCGGTEVRMLAGSPADLPFLAKALELERAQIALYERALTSLRGDDAALARRVLVQERAHAEAIAESIRELGGKPAAPRPAGDYARGLPARGGAAAWVKTAIEREQAAAAAYAAAIPKLANARLKATFAAIMTTEAEHAVALGVSR